MFKYNSNNFFIVEGKQYISIADYVFQNKDEKDNIYKAVINKMKYYKTMVLDLLSGNYNKPTNKKLNKVYDRIKREIKVKKDIPNYNQFYIVPELEVTDKMLSLINDYNFVEIDDYEVEPEEEFDNFELAKRGKKLDTSSVYLTFTYKDDKFFINIEDYSIFFISDKEVKLLEDIIYEFEVGMLFCENVDDGGKNSLSQEIRTSDIMNNISLNLIEKFDENGFIFSKNPILNYYKVKQWISIILLHQNNLGSGKHTIFPNPNDIIIVDDQINYLYEKAKRDNDVKFITKKSIEDLITSLNLKKIFSNAIAALKIDKHICNDVSVVRNKDFTIVGDCRISNRNYDKLINLFDDKVLGNVNIYKVLLRYNKSLATSYLSIPDYGILSTIFGITIEAYASPLNNTFKTYHSAFPDIDKPFGSIGNFTTENLIKDLVYGVNPPYDLYIMKKMSNTIIESFMNNNGNSFVVVIPSYGNDEYNGYTMLKNFKYTKIIKKVDSKDYKFIDHKSGKITANIVDVFFIYISEKSVTKNQMVYVENLQGEYIINPGIKTEKHYSDIELKIRDELKKDKLMIHSILNKEYEDKNITDEEYYIYNNIRLELLRNVVIEPDLKSYYIFLNNRIEPNSLKNFNNFVLMRKPTTSIKVYDFITEDIAYVSKDKKYTFKDNYYITFDIILGGDKKTKRVYISIRDFSVMVGSKRDDKKIIDILNMLKSGNINDSVVDDTIFKKIVKKKTIEKVPDVKSQKQFKAIWKKDNLKEILMKWIGKNISNKVNSYNLLKRIKNQIDRMVDNGEDDKEIYNKLNFMIKNTKNKRYFRKFDRVAYRVKEIKNFLRKNINIYKVDSYLDIGSAEGSLTVGIGQMLNLDKDNIYGVDVRDVKNRLEDFQFKQISGSNLPYEDNSISFITSLMVLHHDKNPEKIVSEIYRVLKPGGYFLLREHDLNKKDFKLFLDIMHGFYELVFEADKGDPYFMNYFSQYKSQKDWDKLVTKSGLEKVTTFKRPSNIRWYYTLYQKPV